MTTMINYHLRNLDKRRGYSIWQNFQGNRNSLCHINDSSVFFKLWLFDEVSIRCKYIVFVCVWRQIFNACGAAAPSLPGKSKYALCKHHKIPLKKQLTISLSWHMCSIRYTSFTSHFMSPDFIVYLKNTWTAAAWAHFNLVPCVVVVVQGTY